MTRTLLLAAPARAALLLAALSACAPRSVVPPTAPIPEQLEPPEELGEAPVPVEESGVRDDLLGDAAYDLPVEAHPRVQAELDFLIGERNAVIGRWLSRGWFYEDHIKEVLRSSGLPTDLYHLAMIESGFNSTALSRAGAAGMWQFMPATGRAEGLRVDDRVDERLDPIRATRAAARHLRRLHHTFQDWALAAAAYNAGTGRITRGLQALGTRDFWELVQNGTLAEETKQYVPRLFAVTIIARDPERFGFPRRDSLAPTFAVDSVRTDLPIPLSELASMGPITQEQLQRLNPHLRAATTPEGSYWIWVPKGQAVALQEAYLSSDYRKYGGYGSYVVRWGDSLGRLGEISGVGSARIRELNPSVDFDRLKAGQKLKLPYLAAQQLSSRPEEKKAEEKKAEEKKAEEKKAEEKKAEEKKAAGSAKSKAGAEEHRVQEGETLWALSQRYGVTVEALQQANGLDGTVIVPGRTLRIPAGASRSEGPKKPAPVEHVVASGETLWSISRHYDVTVDAIEKANDLKGAVIRPGQTLKIPR